MASERDLLLDVTRLIWRRWVGRLPTGIDRVCLAYLDEFRGRSQAVVQRRGFRRILSVSASDELFDMLAAPGKLPKGSLLRLLTSQLPAFGRAEGAGRLYLNVGHTALQDPEYLRWTRSTGVRPVYMVHDLIPITHPQFCRPGEDARHSERMGNILASAVGVIGNSQATLDSLKLFADRQSVAMPAQIAAPLGNEIKPPAARTRREEAARPYFVILGTIEARKNHLLLLRIWERLIASMGKDAPRLLVIGQRGWECEDVFALLDRSEILKSAVTEIGRCSDDELALHLSGARALLFPSLAEGYGLPLVEALSAGAPVLASDLAVFREIGQGVPEFIDPEDEAKWERRILDYAAPEGEAREAQLGRLATFRAPTWNDHFASVNNWLALL